MKKKVFILFSIFLTVFATLQANAQGSLTLTEALRESEGRSPDLKKVKATAERLSWAKVEAFSGYMPHVGVGYDHYLSSDYMREDVVFGGAVVGFPAAYPQDMLTVDVSLNLFDGLTTTGHYQAAALYAEAAELDLKRARLRVEENVRLAYYQALAAQKLLDVAEQNVKTLEDHLSRAQLTERVGYGTRFDVLRIEASLEEARAERESALNNVQIARETLGEVMGIEKMDGRPLVGELPVLKEQDVPRDLSLESMERDDVKAQMKRDEAAMKTLKAARGFWFPSASVFAEEQFYKFGDFDPAVRESDHYQTASAVGLRLKWNLFDGGASYARQREAGQAAIEANAETQKLRASLPREFESWKRKYFYSISLYNARVRALAQFQESVRLAGLGVKTGSRTHTEMLDAELDLFRARAGVVRAQADALEALGKLELALGRRLTSTKL